MKKSRIAALRRMVAECQAGLSRTNEEYLLRVITDLLDEVEFLKSMTPDPGLLEQLP